MAPNFSRQASSLQVILISLQSLPVPLPTLTLSVAFHSFSYSVTTRLPSGLHIHYLCPVSLILHSRLKLASHRPDTVYTPG